MAFDLDEQAEFCGICGAQNPSGSERCQQCGGLIAFEGRQAIVPLAWRWVLVLAGALALMMVVVHITPIIKAFYLQLSAPSRDVVLLWGRSFKLSIFARGGLVSLGLTFALFFIAGTVVAAIAKRHLLREAAISGVIASLVLWVVWAIQLDGKIGMLLSTRINLMSHGGQLLLQLPGLMFLITINILATLFAVLGARLGQGLAEKMTSEGTCMSCGDVYKLSPKRPLACAACGMPLRRGHIAWGWIGGTVSALLLVYVLLVSIGGPRLSFYWQCDFAKPTESCKTGAKKYREARFSGNSSYFYWRQRRAGGHYPGGILHRWKYVGIVAPLFFFVGLIVAWKGGKGRLRSAALAVVIAWVAVTLTAFFALGFAQFSHVFLMSLQLHMIGGIGWCVLGMFGLAIGQRLGRGNELEVGFD
jgi:hypothetical protein